MKREETKILEKGTKRSFSDFFINATPEEKRRVIEEVIDKSNQAQRDLVKKYEKVFPK